MSGPAEPGSVDRQATTGPHPASGSGPDPAQGGVASYEHARDELADVVARLEAGGLDLDESLVLWERGEQLAAICSRFLDGARQRVAAALARSDPQPGT